MNENWLRPIITVSIMIVIFVVALKLLSFAFYVLFPVAVIIVIAYIVYSFIQSRR